MFNTIKNKLTDLLKKFNEYQLPSKGHGKIKVGKQVARVTEGYDHPNFSNFATITAAEKKKLA